MLPTGTRAGLDVCGTMASDPAAVWASPTVNASGPITESSLVDWLEMAVMVGTVLAEARVWTRKSREKVVLAPWLSVTVTVIVARPVALLAGFKTRVPVVLGLV